MSFCASWPRMRNWSPFSVPPSPIDTVMPGTLRSACSRVTIFCSFSCTAGITFTACGVSSSVVGWAARPVVLSRAWLLPVTSTRETMTEESGAAAIIGASAACAGVVQPAAARASPPRASNARDLVERDARTGFPSACE